jgi:hypothetical protein
MVKNMKKYYKTVNELVINNKKCPLPLSVIPNYMGINLCSVEAISWEKQSNGQLINLSIYFKSNKNYEKRKINYT